MKTETIERQIPEDTKDCDSIYCSDCKYDLERCVTLSNRTPFCEYREKFQKEFEKEFRGIDVAVEER